jgi:hypothetical protein
MAIRDAAIRVTMKNAGFMSGLRDMGDKVNSAGTKMGRALAGPMKAGVDSAKASFGDLMGSMKDHMKTAATLGGAFAIGSFIKDGIEGQTVYRNIAHELQKVNGEIKDWRDVHAMIEPIAEKTGQTGDAMAETFSKVFADTGNMEFAMQAMEAIGTAATASGRDATQFGQLAQLAFRKFGVEGGEVNELIARLDSQLGVGGAALDGMSDKFGMMATEAVGAGLGGADGMVKLLGALRSVDAEVGEKAPAAFKAMFVALKENTSGFEKLQKASGIKFKPDMDAFDKIKEMLKSKKGREAMEVSFTGDTRTLFDSLVKPFDAAVEKSKGAGKDQRSAVEDGIAAFDAALGSMGDSTATFEALQKKAAERMVNDPALIWQANLEKMADVFGEPRMIEAVGRLAKLLPAVADGFVKFMDFAVNHPLLTMGGLVGAKVGLAFTQGALVDAGSRIGGSLMSSAAPLLKSNAFSAGTVMGGAAKLALVAGAAFIGFELGKYIAESFWENKQKAESDAKSAEIEGFNAERGTAEQKNAAIEAIRTNIANLKSKQGGLGEWYENASGAIANQIDPSIGMKDTRADQIAKLEAQERTLMESLKGQEEANKKNSAASRQAAQDVSEFGNAAADALKKIRDAGGGGSGGSPPGPLPVTPGHGGI